MADTIATMLVKVGADVDDLKSGLDGAVDIVEQMGNKMMSAGKMLSGALTLPILAIGAAAIEAGVQFDNALDGIRIKTGATGAAMEGLSGSFEKVFTGVPVSAEQASDAIAGLNTRLGLTGAPLESMATQMLNLARITGSEVAPLIAEATRAFGDWSIATEKQGPALDYLFKVTQSTGIGIGQLMQQIVQFGAPMRDLGFSFEQAAMLMGRFEKEGVNMQTVMSGLKFAIGGFGKAGIDFQTGFKAAVDAIKNAPTEMEATAIAFETFGKRAGSDMGRAIREGRFELDEMVKAVQASGETINKAAADTDGFAEKWILFKNNMTAALEPLGTLLLDTLNKLDFKPIISSIETLVGWFTKLPSGVQTAAFAFTGLGAAIGPLLMLGGGAASGLKEIMSLLKSDSIKGTAEGFRSLESAASLLSTALKAAGIAAIAFIGAWAGWELLKDIGESFRGLGITFESVKSDLSSVASTIREFGAGLFKPIEDAVTSVIGSFNNFGISTNDLRNALASLIGTGPIGSIVALISQMDFSQVTFSFENFKRAVMSSLGPLGAFSDLMHRWSGRNVEMDAAVKNVSAGLQSQTQAWMAYQGQMAGSLTTVEKVPAALGAANPHITSHGDVTSKAAKGVKELSLASEMARIEQEKHNNAIRDAAKWLSDYGVKWVEMQRVVSGGLPVPDVKTWDGKLNGPPTGIPTVPKLPGPPDADELDLPTTTEDVLSPQVEERMTRMQELTGHVREGIKGITSDIIDSMVHWSSWGDVGQTALNGLKAIGEMVLQSIKDAFLDSAFMTKITESLTGALTGALSRIPVLGELMGVAGGAAGTATNVAGSASGAAGGAGGGLSQAASGLTGAINMVTGAVSAVADVFSAIGTFRLEGTMNQVERNTAQLSINMVHLISEMQAWLPRLGDLKEALYIYIESFASMMTTIEDLTATTKRWIDIQLFDRENGGGTGSGNTYQITIENLRDAADVDYLVAQLTERGLLPA